MLHICKMILSPVIFSFLQNFDFLGCKGVKGEKNGPKSQKIPSVGLHISGSIHHLIGFYGTHVLNNNISRHYFHVFKILIFWVHRGVVKGQKTVQNDKKILSILLHISGTIHQMIVIYGAHL